MNKSDSIKNLAEALAKAQAEMPPVPMDSKSYYGKYATLGAVIDTTRPVLEKYDLSISQFATSEKNGDVGVTTVLMHASGEWMESTITLPLAPEERKTLAQIAGSIISYLRRYSWSAALGLYSDEDIDGEARPVSKPKATRKSGDVPVNTTELYAMALELPGIEHTNHARNIMQNHLKGGDIGAFIRTSPENLRVLWNVLVEYSKAKQAEEEDPLPF